MQRMQERDREESRAVSYMSKGECIWACLIN